MNWSARMKKVAVGASVVLGSLGVGGGALALSTGGTAGAATSPQSTSTPSSTTHPRARRVLRFLALHAVDGTVTVRTKEGFETVEFARGTISALSNSSISVRTANSTTVTAALATTTHYRNTSLQQLGEGQRVGIVEVNGTARLVNAPKTSTKGATTRG